MFEVALFIVGIVVGSVATTKCIGIFKLEGY